MLVVSRKPSTFAHIARSSGIVHSVVPGFAFSSAIQPLTRYWEYGSFLSTTGGFVVASVLELDVCDEEDRPAENAVAPTPIARMAMPRTISFALDSSGSLACFTESKE